MIRKIIAAPNFEEICVDIYTMKRLITFVIQLSNGIMKPLKISKSYDKDERKKMLNNPLTHPSTLMEYGLGRSMRNILKKLFQHDAS